MQHKLDPKSLVFVFLRYNEKYKGYWCYYPPTGRVFITRHVLFDENSFPFGDIYSSYHAKSSSALLNAWQDASLIRQHSTQISPNTVEELVHCPQTVEGTATAPQVVLPVPSPPHPGSPTSVSATESDETMTNNQQEEVHEEEVQQSQPVHPMTTRAKAGISKPNPKYALITVKDQFAEPKSVKSTLKHPGQTKAMDTEVDNMVETGTFELTPPEEDQNPLSCQWVYKKKINANGTVRGLRIRLVARGNEQEQGVNFIETFSHVVCTATIRTVLHVAVTKKCLYDNLMCRMRSCTAT